MGCARGGRGSDANWLLQGMGLAGGVVVHGECVLLLVSLPWAWIKLVSSDGERDSGETGE